MAKIKIFYDNSERLQMIGIKGLSLDDIDVIYADELNPNELTHEINKIIHNHEYEIFESEAAND